MSEARRATGHVPADGLAGVVARVPILGAAFLMATSAIGPGFLTQTATFTERLGASFGFAILVSVLLDIGAQLNVWRVVAVAGRPAQEIAEQVMPGLGRGIAWAVALGGLAFNIGNVAGCALGLQALLGLPFRAGAALSALVAILLFVVREAGRAMDRFTQVLGVLMIALTVWVAIASAPPLGEAVMRTFVPTRLELLPIVTLVGGTVGGYITFAGAHRLLDAGVRGEERLPDVDRSAVTGIVVTALMRVVLFLAVLGVVVKGGALDAQNPAGTVFQRALGPLGFRLFGLVMWSAAVTSVVGASYTSVSFLRNVLPVATRRPTPTIVMFIVVSAIAFVLYGRPVQLLIMAGAVNAFVLPVALGAMLLAARRPAIVGGYRHPAWMTLAGVTVAAGMAVMAAYTLAVTVGRA